MCSDGCAKDSVDRHARSEKIAAVAALGRCVAGCKGVAIFLIERQHLAVKRQAAANSTGVL